MSWSFQIHKVNQSFEAIASWYREFMHRTELCFRAMNQRITRLEERQGPSDEQLERVLRKILAEKFSDGSTQRLPPIVIKEEECFVENARKNAIVRPIHFDPATLLVDPESVPSKAYAETFNMLQGELVRFPNLETNGVRQQGDQDDRMDYDTKHVREPYGV